MGSQIQCKDGAYKKAQGANVNDRARLVTSKPGAACSAVLVAILLAPSSSTWQAAAQGMTSPTCVGSKLYWWHSNETLTWQGATDRCQGRYRGALAMVDSAAANQLVRSMVVTQRAQGVSWRSRSAQPLLSQAQASNVSSGGGCVQPPT
jgi:hypothetical protein